MKHVAWAFDISRQKSSGTLTHWLRQHLSLAHAQNEGAVAGADKMSYSPNKKKQGNLIEKYAPTCLEEL